MIGDAALRMIERQKARIARLRHKDGMDAKTLARLDELELVLDRQRERLQQKKAG